MAKYFECQLPLQRGSIFHDPRGGGGEEEWGQAAAWATTSTGRVISQPFDLGSWYIIRPDFSINLAGPRSPTPPWPAMTSPIPHIDILPPFLPLRSRGATGPEGDHLVREGCSGEGSEELTIFWGETEGSFWGSLKWGDRGMRSSGFF